LGKNDELLKQNEDATCDLRVRVVCSAGTYVRTLAEEVGKKLGIGAHLAELRRTRAGQFKIEAAMTLADLAELSASNLFGEKLISPHAALAHLPEFELDDKQARLTMNGLDLEIDPREMQLWDDGGEVRLSKHGELIAVGKFDHDRNVVHPAVVLTTA